MFRIEQSVAACPLDVHIAALGEDQSVNVQGIYEFSDSEYIQYNVVIPLKYVSMGEDIFDSAMSFRYAE